MSSPPEIPLRDSVNASARPEYGSAMETEVTAWMLAAKGGDSEAFGQLVERLRARAHTVAFSLVGSREDARDLCQEAFAKTWRARATYRDDAPFLPWFHRILRNTCFSFLRKKGRIRASSLSSQTEEAPDWDLAGDEETPFARLEMDDVQRVFWKAMDLLSARDREILVLRQFQDLSYREIAHTLEIPEGTVMSRLFHARKRLRSLLEPHLEGALADYAGGEER